MKRVMIYIGVLIVGLSWTVLYTYLCYRLFGSVATLVIIGIQIILGLGIVFIRIRGPDVLSVVQFNRQKMVKWSLVKFKLQQYD